VNRELRRIPAARAEHAGAAGGRNPDDGSEEVLAQAGAQARRTRACHEGPAQEEGVAQPERIPEERSRQDGAAHRRSRAAQGRGQDRRAAQHDDAQEDGGEAQRPQEPERPAQDDAQGDVGSSRLATTCGGARAEVARCEAGASTQRGASGGPAGRRAARGGDPPFSHERPIRGSGPAAAGGARNVSTGTAGATSVRAAATPAAAAPLAAGLVAAAEPERIGAVTHYWPHANACAVLMEHGELHVGDTVHVRGHTTDFYQRVDRIELEHVAVQVARIGDHIGLEVHQRVREGDDVFRLKVRRP